MQNKKICIFGGAGFVGRYLCAQVLSYNNHVTIMDIVEEPKWIYDEKAVRYVNVSSDFELTYLEQQFDYVFLLAGNASVSKSVSNPIFDVESNTLSILKLLSHSSLTKTKLVFFSSAAVYGEMEKGIRLSPISPYGISKAFTEKYLKFYNRNYGVPVLICRFFSLFGNYNTKQVIYDMAKKIITDSNEMVIINPKHRRDFIHIEEALDAMLFLCENSTFSGEAFDIGLGESISIMQLYQQIAKILDFKSSPPLKLMKNIGDPKVQIANIKPLKELGYVFNKGFEVRLRETVEWISDNHD